MTTNLPLKSGTWALDPAHSGVYFKVRHLGLTNVRGEFNTFDAALNVGDDL
jgi:polyisoprenoid-binding protein YceI